ncbi:MAG: transglutaminase family protein [Cyclobacteriaceae bacterium]
MNLRIEHKSHYSYTSKVFVEPQHFYFHPCYRPYISLKDFKIKVHPEPAGLAQRIDAEGNIYYQCWFNDPIKQMTVETFVSAMTHEFNPFDFLVEENPKNDHIKSLLPFTDKVELSEEIKSWSKDIWTLTSTDIITFVTMLAREINSSWKHEANYDSQLVSPNDCFLAKKGSCRDLAWLFIQVVRHYDLPTRFVSGYGYNPELIGHELHAWAEVWVTGAGWIGVDPSSGLLTTHAYIPLAASYHPSNTMPVQGSFRGKKNDVLTTSVKIEAS